jgi:amidase
VVNRAPLLEKHRDKMKPEMIWNIEKGMAQSSGDLSVALRERGALYQRVATWFEDYDVLACPAAIVAPFDVDMRYVEQVGDHKFANYVDWLYITFAITLTGCPAISVPVGFTASGLPVGLQLVGRPRGEAELLSYAARLEEIVNISPAAPIDPRPA